MGFSNVRKLHFSHSKSRLGGGGDDGSISNRSLGDGSIHSSNESHGSSSGRERRRCIRRLVQTRAAVLGFLVILATFCGVVTYEFTSSAEQDIYKEQFARYAGEIDELSETYFQSIISKLSFQAMTISSLVLDIDTEWPFVTISNFDKFQWREAENITMYVCVKEEEKVRWENYSVANQGWIQQGLDERGIIADTIIPYIHKGETTLPDNGPADPSYTVAWQIAPSPEIPTMVNSNVLSNTLAETLQRLLTVLPVTSSEMLSGPSGLDTPSSHIFYPIYNQLDEDGPNRTIVGYLDAVIPWQTYFSNILSNNMAPLVVVLRNDCGQTATYGLDGGTAVLLSHDSDVHDHKFDDWEYSSRFSSNTLFPVDSVDGIFEAIDSTEESLKKIHCTYEYSVYPTQAFEDAFLSFSPLTYTAGFVGIFFLTIFLIYLYDFMRDRQKKSVENAAAKDVAILTSLFPAQVRDRLIRDNAEVQNLEQPHVLTEKKGGDRRQMFTKQKTNRTLSLSNHGIDIDDYDTDDEDGHCAKLLLTRPIADLFPNATVMFADIAGFTKWSSDRQPAEVFILLETLYGEFDKVARRERIFKVETIGDCYVAVTGLPEPRADHAEAMCRFALKCLAKTKYIFEDLAPELGRETADLGMRFGLHSGPVTAGVLRGEKSRFQLFGDTVNTTARIETTGKRECIHLSQNTGKLLISRGKDSWVELRDDKVVAKGKGQLSTYWFVLSEKADVLKQLVEIKERTDRRKRYPNAFIGAEAVDALVYNGLATSRIDAVHLLRIMEKDLMLFKNVTDDEKFGDDLKFYRFYDFSGTSRESGKYSVWDNEIQHKAIKISKVLKPRRSLAEQAQQFSESLDIRDHKYHMKTYKNSFVGSEAVDGILFSGVVKTREEAVNFIRRLEKELRLFYCISKSDQPFKSSDQPFKDDDHEYYRLRKPRKLSNNLDASMRSLLLDNSFVEASSDLGVLTEKMEMFKTVVAPLVAYRKSALRGYKNVFVGEEAIDALVYAGFAKTRRETIYFARLLVKNFHLFHHVLNEQAFCDGYMFYRFGDVSDYSLSSSLHSIRTDYEFDEPSESNPSSMSEIGNATLLRGELGEKADLFKKYTDVRDRAIVRIGSTKITYKSCFIGSEVVDALVYAEVVKTRKEAVALGLMLAKELRLFNSVTGSIPFKDEFQYYRFRSDDGRSRDGHATEIDYLARKELIKKAEAFEKCCHVKDRYYHFRKYKQCFIGKDTVDAALKAGVVETRTEAVELARTLARELNLLRHVCEDHAFCDDYLFFRLDDKDIREQKMKEYMKGFEDFQQRSSFSADAAKGLGALEETTSSENKVEEADAGFHSMVLPVLQEGEEDVEEDDSLAGSKGSFRDMVHKSSVKMDGFHSRRESLEMRSI